MKYLSNQFLYIFIIINCNLSIAQNFWQATNGPQGGVYRDFSTNKITGNSYLVTHWNTNHGNGLGGNLFTSPNGGISWIEIDNGLLGQAVYNIASSTTNNDLILSTAFSSTAAQSIIYHSPNNGSLWVQKNSSVFTGSAPAVAMLFNLTGDTIFAGKKNVGVMCSINSGSTWSVISTGLTNLNSTDLEYGYQGKLYTCTDSINATNGAKVFVKNGLSWTNVSTGLPNTRINDLYYHSATSTMYLGTANSLAGVGRIYKSVNGGAWTQVSGYPGTQVLKISTTTNGDPLVRALDQGVWRYLSGIWTTVNSNLNSLKTTAFTSVGSGTILLTTNAGIWKFNDANNNWSYFTNGIKNSQGRSMAFSQNGDVVVGTDNGMYRSTDGGNTWAHAGLTDTAMMSTILYAPDGRMFAGNTHPTASHIFTSINNGASWYTNETGFSSTRSSDFDYNSQGKIFIGTGWANPMHSSSDGVNWNGPSGPTLGFLPSSLALAIAINSVDVIFAGTENDGVYRSIDNGVSYSYIGLANNPSNISDIKISPNQDVFVSQTPFTGNGNGNFYRSKNGGNTWSANLMSTHGLPNCIYIAGPDSIFVGTTKGVWLSTDTASTWTLLNSGLNPGNLIIHTLEIGPDGYLYAGTAGAGIYKSANKIKGGTLTGVTKHVSQNTRMMIYPNPANDLLNFSSAIKDLKIYNLLGELVLQKVGELNSVSTSNLTNGIYFIRTNQGTLKFIVKH